MQPLFISGWGATDQVWERVLSAMPGTNPQFICWAECAQNWPRALASALSEDEQVVASGSSTPARGNRALGTPACPEGPSARGGRYNQYCVVGWSLGGLLALRAALEFPDKIAELVLISSSARMCAAEDYPGADARALAAMQARLARDPERVLRGFADLCAAPDGNGEVRARYLHEAAVYSPAQLAAGLDCLATLDLRSRLSEVRASCLLLHGGCDGVIPVASAQYLAAKLPNAELKVLEGRGHALPFTAPQEVAQHLRSFFA